MDLFESLKDKINGKHLRIVFPEGEDPRVLGAAVRLAADGLVQAIVSGNPDKIQSLAAEKSWDLSKLTVRDPEHDELHDQMVTAFVERRKGKATQEQAEKIVQNANYFGTMLIKTRPGVHLVSGAFIMQRGRDERYLFADNAINIDPDADQLAEIAVESAKTAALFDIEPPRVALLSFSTKGSAKGPQVDKVVEATKKAHELAPDLALDGELQFDAAFVPTVAKQKAPDSKVAGEANVFIFPELQSGNIGYKIAQRFGGFEAIGPILQGLNQPVSDLSRGANEEDVYKLAIITAAQTLL